MKKIVLLMGFIFVLGTISVNAQKQQMTAAASSSLEEDEGPIVFKFEPDLLAKNEARKAEISRVRKIIDTLHVSDRKRRKLIKDMYINGGTPRLKKALLVAVKFEDFEE